jgi:ankyrin repeat protein
MNIIHRKQFLSLALLGSAGLVLRNKATAQQQRPDPLDKELVKEFVRVCHGDLTKTKDMLAQQPALLNAAWDWGGGDFETGLEGAGHVGNRDVAQFLLEKGARMNIFCAAMLGKIEIVRSLLTAFPDLKQSKGPHGLQLLHHARKGGEQAKEMLDYLQSIGAS